MKSAVHSPQSTDNSSRFARTRRFLFEGAARELLSSVACRLSTAWRSQAGVTLLELTVAITIFILLALSAGTLYSTVLKTHLKNKLTQDLQRDSDAVLTHMSSKLRTAATVVPPTICNALNANAVSVLAGTEIRTYDVSNNQIRYTPVPGSSEILLSPGSTVQSLTFFPTCDSGSLKAVKVNAVLARSKGVDIITLTIGSTITTRPQ